MPNENMRREAVVLESRDFEVSEQEGENSDGVIVEGVAMPLGMMSRNGIIYEPESTKQAAGSMEGNSVLFNHDENVAPGFVEQFREAGDELRYRINVDPKSEAEDGVSYARKLRRGDIKSVSIRAMAQPMNEEQLDGISLEDNPADAREVVEVDEFMELSLVTVPGFPETTASVEGVAVAEAFKDVDESGQGRVSEEDNEEEDVVSEQTFGDYPEAAQENARMALEARDDTGNPNDCGTRVGWERANQLDNGEDLSADTVGRMAAFSRHEDNSDMDDDEGRSDCGWMMWNAWGGDEGIEWAERKMNEMDEGLRDEVKSRIDTMSDDNTQDEDVEQEQTVKEFDESEVDEIVTVMDEVVSQHLSAAMDDLRNALLEDESEANDGYMDDEDDEEDEEGGKMPDDEDDEDEESVERVLKDRIDELEERLDTLLENDDGSSKQEQANGSDESDPLDTLREQL